MKLLGKATALALTGLFALAACSSDDALEETADGLTKLTVYHITTVDSTPLYLGVEEGFFEEEGLDVEVKIAESGSAIIPSVVNGESPIGYANVVSDLAAIDQGLDIKLVSNCCGVAGTSDETSSRVFVLEDSDIQGPEDLAGKTIAVNSTKNLGDVTIPVALENQGIDASTIEYVPMNFADMSAALERGDVDAIWMVEPFQTIAYDNGYRPVLANFAEAFPNSTLGYYITSGDFADENPETVAAFQRALDRTNEYASENHDKLRELAVSEIGLTEDVASRIAFATFEPGLDTESVETYAKAAVDFGIISKEPDYSSIFVQPGN
ncbi:ABC transporter substrate-binding protein [Flaviflexus equikiangi]|uniref:ABC transporter substrate-binding protein n=1 Tax=Flaviflexus equikiangi TaxID=2758573 RepID=A0ABS2TCN9_9ACTO|nr:ABC transporter substrate-binding protein [Flaviflexus equikiangi]MBM9432413.1 ABC transporter substrate-binding protein [Flaviflexus equikiangi]